MHQEVASSVVFEESEILPEKVQNQEWKCWLRGVGYEKPFAKIFTSQCTGKHPCSNHDDPLEV